MEQKTLSIVAKARDDASKELKKVQDAVDKTADSVGKSTSGFDKFSAGLDKAGGAMVGAGKKMSVGLTLPIVAMGVSAVNALNQIEVLSAQTETVIKSTGGAAKVTREQVEGYANTLEKMTGAEAEAIQTGQNMLLTFTNIRNEQGKGNDIFDQSTKIMLDMATAMNGGVVPSAEALKAQSIQLGKALNDPMKGLTALSKVGVSFTDDQKKQIKTMQEAGDTMGAQKIILAELNKEFGGSAESFGNTTAGKVAKLKNQFGEITENLVVGLMPALNNIAAEVEKLMNKFQALTPEQQAMIAKIVGIIAVAGPALIIFGKIAQGLTSVVKAAVMFGKGIATMSSLVVKGFGAIRVAMTFLAAHPVMLILIAVIAVIAGLAYLIITNWETVKSWFNTFWQAIQTGAQAFADFFVGIWNWLKEAVTAVWEGIKTAVGVAFEFIKGIVMFYINAYVTAFKLILAGAQLVWNGIKVAAEFIFNVIKTIITTYINAYIAIFNWIKNAAVAVWNAIGNGLKFVWNNIISPVVNFIKNAFQNVANAISGVFNWVVNTARNSFNNVVNTIKSVFEKVTGFITAPFKSAFNAVADLWNNTLGSIKWKAPDWVPGIGGKEIGFPKMPKLATGGIVTGPTVAMIGEGREPEAVIPLSKLDAMLGSDSGPSTEADQPAQINVTVNVPGGIFTSDSSLADLAILIGQQLEKQMKVQGTTNVNMMRARG
jgi:hypothetical protein